VRDGYAQSIETVEPLDFGEATVRRNDAVYDITIASTGSVSAGANFDYVTSGKVGVYRLTGAAPLRPITVSVSVDQQMISAGQQMVIDNFDIDAPPNTDASGEAIINIGARIRTNGNGTNYVGNSNFIALMTLTVNVL